MAEALQALVGGRVLTGEAELRRYSVDFGRLAARQPRIVVPIRGEDEACSTFRLLRAENVAFTIRGQGASCSGRTLSGGVVLQNVSSGRPPRPGDGEVDVEAGTPWSEVVDALSARARAMPVLTHNLAATVGGTLSAGGYGTASVRAGAQVDHVARLRVVLPSGEALWCGPEEHADVFAAANGGLGRVAYIARAVLRTAAAKAFVRLTRRDHRGLAALGEHVVERSSSGETPLHLWGEWVPGRARSHEARDVVAADLLSRGLGAPDGADRILPTSALHAKPRPGQGCPPGHHVWCDYFVDAAGLRPFLAAVERLAPPAGPCFERAHILSVKPPEHPERRSLLPLPRSAAGPWFGVGVFFSPAPGDRVGLSVARSAQHELLEQCRAVGGRPYLCGAHGLGPADWGAFYGEEARELEKVRTRYDPGGIFNDGGAGSAGAR